MDIKNISNFPVYCKIAYYPLIFPTGEQENNIFKNKITQALLPGGDSETDFLHPEFGCQRKNNYAASATYLNRAHPENIRPDVRNLLLIPVGYLLSCISFQPHFFFLHKIHN